MTQAVRSDILPNNAVIKSSVPLSNLLFTPIVMAILIFLITALVGVWAAPDRSAAVHRFLLLAGGVALTGGIAWGAKRNVESVLGVLGLVFSLLAVGLTIHFLLTVNWDEAGSARFSIIEQFGRWVQYYVLDLSALPHLQKNITGGILLIVFPLGLAGTLWAWTNGHRLLTAASIITLVIVLFGLVMSNSRGAWLGFVFGAMYSAYFYWRFGPGYPSKIKWVGDFLIAANLMALVAGFWLVATVPEYREFFNQIIGDRPPTRADVWQFSLPLVQDYWYTGSGLGSTTMVLSSYVLLLHVPYLAHTHNLFLQIAVEQGMPGLITFVILIIFTLWALTHAYRQGSWLIKLYCTFAVASLTGMLVHGTVEANLYAYQAMPLMFLPFGFALALISVVNDDDDDTVSDLSDKASIQRVAVIGGFAPSLIIAFLFLWPGSMANLQANLGAVAQTRAELAVYVWPEWPLQDELRRNQVVNLTPAINHYKTALSKNPTNVTALRRLGQIEISLGNYDVAQHYLEAAYQAAPDQRATRQMLGEIYAIDGNLPEALALWQPLDLDQGQLDARQWWYYHIGADDMAELIKQAEIQRTP
ncbi:MAG: O-antigen ligase family protein [Anaerolineae bacterium]|nr:O-antigen ligase family protein [Anaerolineae bacterium]